MSIYQYSLQNAKGEDISLANYQGKVLLIVNTALHCGFTPQFNELEKFYQKYHQQGLEIIDIPTNQFNSQTPESDEEIHEFCTLNFGTTYPRFAKAEVNGDGQLPLYAYLKEKQAFKGFPEGATAERIGKMVEQKDPQWLTNPNIKWNFTKFLVNRKGEVVDRFEPMASLEELEKRIQEIL